MAAPIATTYAIQFGVRGVWCNEKRDLLFEHRRAEFRNNSNTE